MIESLTANSGKRSNVVRACTRRAGTRSHRTPRGAPRDPRPSGASRESSSTRSWIARKESITMILGDVRLISSVSHGTSAGGPSAREQGSDVLVLDLGAELGLVEVGEALHVAHHLRHWLGEGAHVDDGPTRRLRCEKRSCSANTVFPVPGCPITMLIELRREAAAEDEVGLRVPGADAREQARRSLPFECASRAPCHRFGGIARVAARELAHRLHETLLGQMAS